MEYILYFDYAEIVIYFVMFINMCYKKTIRTRSADLFTALLFSSLWSNLFDISGTLMLDNASVRSSCFKLL